jgi:hypothetical protein
MPKTRLYVQCPNCRTHYLVKDFELTYSNGAYIENVAGAPEWQRLLCPCRPREPFKFKLSETTRLHLFSEEENERTHLAQNESRRKTNPRIEFRVHTRPRQRQIYLTASK